MLFVSVLTTPFGQECVGPPYLHKGRLLQLKAALGRIGILSSCRLSAGVAVLHMDTNGVVGCHVIPRTTLYVYIIVEVCLFPIRTPSATL
jgi:hypothetical protein